MIDREQLHQLRALVRAVAQDELMMRFESVRADRKADGSLITEADLALQRRLQCELAERWPAYSLLGEEMGSAQQESLLRAPEPGLWCLDPLDGTGNFASGIPFFAVSLALLAHNGAQLALVYDPVRDECFSALRGAGAWLNDQRLTTAPAPSALDEAMATVDLKRLPAPLVQSLAQRPPYRSQRSFGSVALDWCWVAANRCQVYLHGGQRLWDYAAGQLILRESGGVGGVLADYTGAWVSEAVLAPRIAIAATHPGLLRQWLDWVRGAVQETA